MCVFIHVHNCDVFVGIIYISISQYGFKCWDDQWLNLQLHKGSTQYVTLPHTE